MQDHRIQECLRACSHLGRRGTTRKEYLGHESQHIIIDTDLWADRLPARFVPCKQTHSMGQLSQLKHSHAVVSVCHLYFVSACCLSIPKYQLSVTHIRLPLRLSAFLLRYISEYLPEERHPHRVYNNPPLLNNLDILSKQPDCCRTMIKHYLSNDLSIYHENINPALQLL